MQSSHPGPSEPEQFEGVGPGVTRPKVRYKIETEYSREARDANVQGTAVFELVVNEQGKATDIYL
jgi:hypothetical protein